VPFRNPDSVWRRGANRITFLTMLTLAMYAPTAGAQGDGGGAAWGLTAVPGIRVGHHTLSERRTGCTVVLVQSGAVGGVDVRGGAPGTRETDLLDPVNSVQQVHAIVLSGGSAFGLETATGVVRYLEERGIGFPTGSGPVPIVPAAILYDLWLGDPAVRPDAACGYQAAQVASTGTIAEGSVGAGAGATLGRLRGLGRGMRGGLGTASVTLDDGLVVAALVAVNALGDVIDPNTGAVVAGVRTPDGRELADARRLLRENAGAVAPPLENTTIGVVATNARLTKAQATKVAQMAQDGYARAIYPAHGPWDGDVIFSLATGDLDGEAELTVVGALAADVMAEAIVRAVRHATGADGIPAVRDLPHAR
jgi:L-aminopeptidase/D-esterase-like protein